MERHVRVAAIQLEARGRGDFPKAFDAIARTVRRAARDADLVVLPEATLPAYVMGMAPLAPDEIEREIEQLRAIARDCSAVIVAGAAVRDDDGMRNAALVIDADGTFAGRADKLFLWHFDRRWFSPGERLEPIQTRLGALGVLVCADGRLPTISRALVDRGAQALVMPTAWVTTGRDSRALENVQADLLARVRAYENHVPFIAANKCGSELSMVAYCGKSQIVAADGDISAIAGARRAQTITAGMTLGDPRPRRAPPCFPAPRDAAATRTLRIAFSFDSLPGDIAGRLAVLDNDCALGAQDAHVPAALDRAVGAACVDDSTALDPGGLVPYRRAGYALICWRSDIAAPWLERIARARALELRIYVVVFDCTTRRAFAVDPDGTIVAGTFGGYRLASFTLDPCKTHDTAVAPGTDIAEGLDRIAGIIERSETLASRA